MFGSNLGYIKIMYLYLILGIAALTITCQDICKKKFNQRSEKMQKQRKEIFPH